MWEWLQNDADKAFGWSFLGFWVGLIIGAVGLWAAFYYQRQPRLSVAILSRTPVLSLKEKIDKLRILYDNADILESQKKLYVMTLRITNNGRANIGKGDYDDRVPLSFQIIDAENSASSAEIEIIQEPEVLKASDDYLEKYVVLQRASQATVVAEPIILDAGQFFTIKLVALMPETVQPTVRLFGKVAGIKKIELADELKANRAEQNVTALVMRMIPVILALILGVSAASDLARNVSELSEKLEKLSVPAPEINLDDSSTLSE